MYLGEPHEHPGVVAIVIGDVVGFRIGRQELLALVEGHSDDERIGILLRRTNSFPLTFRAGVP